MHVRIFETIDELNEFLKHRKPNDVDIKYQSEVVQKTIDKLGKVTYEILDRFLVIER